MIITITRWACLVVAILFTGGRANATTQQDDSLVRPDGVLYDRIVTPDVAKTLLQFAIAPTREQIDGFTSQLSKTVDVPAFDLMFKNAFYEPIVLLLSVGPSRQVVLLRRGYGDVWLDPRERRLGRVRDYWVMYVSDRSAELTHSILVRTRPFRDFSRQLEFEAGNRVDAFDPPDEVSLTIGMKRMRVPHSPSTQAITFKSYDLATSETRTDEYLFRGYSTRVGFDVGLMMPVAKSSDDERVRPLAIGTLNPFDFRNRERSGEFSEGSILSSLLNFYPNLAFGIELPYSGSNGLGLYVGYEWQIRDGPLGITFGMLYRKRDMGDESRDWTTSSLVGVSLALNRTLDLIAGR